MQNPYDLVKITEIMKHIATLFEHYGEDESFFDEYIQGVIEGDLDLALTCFRDLIKKLPKRDKNAGKSKIKQTVEEQNKIYSDERFRAYPILGKSEKPI
jgi:hypothetical protein